MGCCNAMGMGVGLWPLSLLVGILLIGVLVVVLMRNGAVIIDRLNGLGSGGNGRHARGILQERYARGETSTEEYRERLHTLREDNPTR
ncbi:SHOCT domain-containing protein [Kocuria sediminis]|uniref:SHOCT domain-containing protein n=1 Tax=Kocuria sediminis TaxID=1038857 RepID=A0A6N8GP58_9MICC|nr:SHOCT domain-containing protein [Kocuria sediminis]MUN64688.1 SHOCT domain-containing protein [Kocuria sediminis]